MLSVAALSLLAYATLSSASVNAILNITDDQWAQLNSSVGGRLRQAVPFSRSCFQQDIFVEKGQTGFQGAFNQDECSFIQNNYLNASVRLESFSANMLTQWESCADSICLLDKTNPTNSSAFEPPRQCGQGSVPTYYIEIQEPSDYTNVFLFSNTTAVPTVIKNTGHEYQGRSVGLGRLGLWTHNQKGLSYNKTFIANGCDASTATPAVTIGAGEIFRDLYAYADSLNITVPGGSDPTVGAVGGWLLGGGHSPVSHNYGLGVDRVLEYEVVTGDGDHVFANACKNSDLFWALRGGGPSYAAVLRATVKAYPQTRVQVARAGFDGSDINTQRSIIQFMTDNAVELGQEGWGGYFLPKTRVTFNNPAINADQANNSLVIQNFKKLVETLPNGTFETADEPSYLSFFNRWVVQEALDARPNVLTDGVPFTLATRLIPKDNFNDTVSKAALVNATLDAVQSGYLTEIFQVTPIFANEVDGSQTSVTPAWYSSLWHLTVSTSWNFDTTFAEQSNIYAHLSETIQPLRDLTPNGGAYFSESDVMEPDYETAFWGNNTQQLKDVKLKYDPKHSLDCWHCIGSKAKPGPVYQCYPNVTLPATTPATSAPADDIVTAFD